MNKIEIVYTSGKKEVFETGKYTAETLNAELEIAFAHKKSYLELDGFSLFPNLIKEVREVR